MFPVEFFIGLILIGVAAGFASGLLGVGGGFLMVPLQYYLLQHIGVENNLAMLISLATSLAIIIPTTLTGAYRHTRKMDNILHNGIRLGLFGVFRGLFGDFIASSLPSRSLEIIFGILLLFVCINNIYSINKEIQKPKISFNLLSTAIIGLVVGFLSGLLGIGGGVFLIAILTIFFGFLMIESIGTSSIFISLTAVGGLVSYIISGWGVNTFPFSVGYVSLINLIVICMFSVPVANFSAKLAHKMPEKKLKIIFSILVVYISFKMLGIFS